MVWLLLGALVVLAILFFLVRKKLRVEQDTSAKLRTENEVLARYRDIVDAKAEAERILTEAHKRSDESTRAAATALAQAQADATRLKQETQRTSTEELSQARLEARTLRLRAQTAFADAQNKVESVLRSAQQEAKKLIEDGKKRGEEIAGKAFEAVENAEHFQQIAEAMKNLIDGYGDRYVISSRGLLDELAASYGFTNAGVELKNAIERSRMMVSNETAATCDYVEKNRRDTAIRFVVDAFNGKVDSILSKVKDDNAGTLEKAVRDAFTLVNYNGKAFRNARIQDSYLESRLMELRWAVAVQEIKLREKEEQRQIKEQIREEERAQREFQRAIRDAARSEGRDVVDGARARANEDVAGSLQAANDELKLQSDAIAPNLRASVDTLSETLASRVLGVPHSNASSGTSSSSAYTYTVSEG